MKTINSLFGFFFLGTMLTVQAQEVQAEAEINSRNGSDKLSYYHKRGAEDAQYELRFEAKTKSEEKAFWKEQKAYEKELKERDRKAYRAYIASKKDVYTEHYDHCDAHCHHDDYFYTHARFYYYQYNQPAYYQRTPSTSTRINTQIGVRTPSVRLGL